MCQYNEKDWRELTRMCKDTPFDFIEINLSCPHGMTELGMGRACGEDPVMVENITRWVSQETHLPVIVKLTPNYTDTWKIAEASKIGGAKAVTLTNTFPTLMDLGP